MKKILGIFIAFFITVSFLQAQTFPNKKFDSNYRGLLYSKEFTMDARLLHTRSFALSANFTKIKSYYKSSYYQLEIGNLKHPKEFQQNSDAQLVSQGTAQSFIYGKENSVYVVRGGIGRIRYYSEKAKRKGIAIGVNYEGGATLGLVKPYYLDIRQSDQPNQGLIPTRAERFNPNEPCDFLDLGRIFGSSGFFKGLKETTINPGVHAKIAMHFDWGAFDDFVKAIEAGVMVDVFFQKLPHLVHIDQEVHDIINLNCQHLRPIEVQGDPNRQVFINLFVNIHLGKRW